MTRYPLNRKPWNQSWFWCVLAVLALAAHYAIGSSVGFPVLFIVPIMLAAWHSGVRFAIAMAVVMCVVRFGYFFLESSKWTVFEAALNTVLRLLVLTVIALLTARVGRLQRALLHRVKTLEGLLPICSFCKRIRDEQNDWKQLETYISKRSKAQFSHSVCPECMKEHYDYVSTQSSVGST